MMRAVLSCAIIALFVLNIILCFKLYKSHNDYLQTEVAMLQYFEVTEELLDSLCIYENDSIFTSEIGGKYLDAKFGVDSLMFTYK